MRVRFNRKGRQEGQAMVETALIIMIVLLLLMGIIQFGFLFYAYVRVSNAAREGARAGSLWLMHQDYETFCEQVSVGVWSELPAYAQEEDVATAITLKDGLFGCDGPPPIAHTGDPITVTVTYNYDLPVVTALPIIREVIKSPFPVSRTLMMRIQ